MANELKTTRWENGKTPLSAENLNNIESNIRNLDNRLTTAEDLLPQAGQKYALDADITAHNDNNNAHPKLKEHVQEKIRSHNNATDTHQDIRDQIDSLGQSIEDLDTNIRNSISNNNYTKKETLDKIKETSDEILAKIEETSDKIDECNEATKKEVSYNLNLHNTSDDAHKNIRSGIIENTNKIADLNAELQYEKLKIGDVRVSVRNDADENWLLCEGQEIGLENYPSLYDMIPNKVDVFMTESHWKTVELSDYTFEHCCAKDDYIYMWNQYNPTTAARCKLDLSEFEIFDTSIESSNNLNLIYFPDCGYWAILDRVLLGKWLGKLYVSNDCFKTHKTIITLHSPFEEDMYVNSLFKFNDSYYISITPKRKYNGYFVNWYSVSSLDRNSAVMPFGSYNTISPAEGSDLTDYFGKVPIQPSQHSMGSVPLYISVSEDGTHAVGIGTDGLMYCQMYTDNVQETFCSTGQWKIIGISNSTPNDLYRFRYNNTSDSKKYLFTHFKFPGDNVAHSNSILIDDELRSLKYLDMRSTSCAIRGNYIYSCVDSNLTSELYMLRYNMETEKTDRIYIGLKSDIIVTTNRIYAISGTTAKYVEEAGRVVLPELFPNTIYKTYIKVK